MPTPSEKAAIYEYLRPGEHPLSPDAVQVSCFDAVLRDARRATGRNIDNGYYDLESNPALAGNWGGCALYIVLLDQIGTAIRPSGKPEIPNGTAIVRALKYFSSLSDDEIDALYALRNAFAHDYSLFNKNQSKPNLQHRFELYPDNRGDMITLPPTPWNGQFGSASSGDSTIIRLGVFGDFIEEIVRDIREMADLETIDLKTGVTVEELRERYTFQIFRRTPPARTLSPGASGAIS